jgi:hypothetical protein
MEKVLPIPRLWLGSPPNLVLLLTVYKPPTVQQSHFTLKMQNSLSETWYDLQAHTALGYKPQDQHWHNHMWMFTAAWMDETWI